MLNEALRLIRVFHDIKQYELANRLGVSRSFLSEIETGTKTPSLELLDKYAEEFGIPRSSILFFAEQLPGAKRGEAARRAIASKVLDILRFIEKRSDAEQARV